jgi:hypothetical protein
MGAGGRPRAGLGDLCGLPVLRRLGADSGARVTPTDAILEVVRAQLLLWAPLIDARCDQIDSIKIVVNIDKRARWPRSVLVSPEVRHELVARGPAGRD